MLISNTVLIFPAILQLMTKASRMFLITVITLAYCSSVALSYNCYNCQNFEFEHEFYDSECTADQYSGHTITCEEGTYCFTDVFEDGRLRRGCGWIVNGLQCVYHKYPQSTQCFCEGDLCNIGMCAECIDGSSTLPTQGPSTPTTIVSTPTPYVTTPTTDVTTPTPYVTTTTPDITTTTPDVTTPTPYVTTTTTDILTTTPDVTTPTPDVTTPTPDVTTPTPYVTTTTQDITTTTPDVTTTTPDITTTPPKIESIVCYDCQNTHTDWDAFDETCPELDYDGLTYDCHNCGSCFTEVHDDGTVIRGEAGDITAECAYGLDFIACYCTKDLCNNQLCDHC